MNSEFVNKAPTGLELARNIHTHQGGGGSIVVSQGAEYFLNPKTGKFEIWTNSVILL